ncbi:MAG TPA: hypothetical protein ACHBY4_13115 [Arsenophonus apicola]|uniref:hypothetical protein n=1 Tax=Arsenophonus apicola TaxID=2879119 RepID=UPI0038798617
MQNKSESKNTTYNIINGTDNSDILTGTAKNDQIYGNAGSDQILGYGGNDRILGGAEMMLFQEVMGMII